jgi:hypothetical protein
MRTTFETHDGNTLRNDIAMLEALCDWIENPVNNPHNEPIGIKDYAKFAKSLRNVLQSRKL